MIFISSILVSCSTAIYGAFLFYTLWYHSGSALISSLIYLPMEIIPVFLSPLVGYHVDKYDKKKIGALSIILSSLLIFFLLILYSIMLLYIVYFLLILLEYYFAINYKVSVKIIVGDENLLQANTLYVAGEGVSNLVGFVMGSYIYSFIPMKTFLLIILFLYLSAYTFWFAVKIRTRINKSCDKINEKIKSKYTEVFKFLNENKFILYIIIFYDIIVAILITIDSPAYISLCFKNLKMTAIIYGWYRGLASVGFVIVPFLISKYIKPKNVAKYAIMSLLGEGGIIILMASIPIVIYENVYQQVLFILLALIMTYPSTLQYSSFSSIFQQTVPTNILGRFYSIRSIIRGIIGITFLLFGGFAADTISPLFILYISGIGLFLITFPIKEVLTNIA